LETCVLPTELRAHRLVWIRWLRWTFI